MHGQELGQFDATAAESSSDLRSRLKRRIAQALRENHSAVLFDDLDDLAIEIGRANLFDARLWFYEPFPMECYRRAGTDPTAPCDTRRR
jgi:hypothetical protein